MKPKRSAHTLAVTQDNIPRIGQLIDCRRFSSFSRLLRVTAFLLTFVHVLHARLREMNVLVDTHIHVANAKLLWFRDVQAQLQQDVKFPLWKRQLDLFFDDFQLWRCGATMKHSGLTLAARHPILLDKQHHVMYHLVFASDGPVM